MDPAAFVAVASLLSPERFATYLQAEDGDTVRAVRLYTWNVEISGAFWGPLHAVEVGLRNALHRRMSAQFGRDDWWASPTAGLHHNQEQLVRDALNKLARRGPSTAGQTVAELPLGFWTGLLGRGSAYEHRFWIPALRHAFPDYKGRRADLHGGFESLRLFRNRIAHHEPIFARHLAADYSSILALSGRISPDLRGWVASQSRVETVLGRRALCIRDGIGSSV